MAEGPKYQSLHEWQEERKVEKRAEEDERLHDLVVSDFDDFGLLFEERQV